ncbi:MAG: ATP-binding protein [Blautia sp.]|nr:ATP-binding protein [Blautia sp.]
MDSIDLQREIQELIERHAEGEYWDFKQQWHSCNADLLHDIICMANSPANRDCYIIIGVEDGSYNVLGVSDENRKNQQNVIDLLQQKPSWAGGYIPEVYVKTIFIADKEIDVVVIKQNDNTPFYLLEDYRKEGQPIFKGAIYTRKGDTNTPKTGTADLHDTELLWKRRFGLLYNPSQRAKFYLKDLDNWESVEGEADKSGREGSFFFYRPDPDYTVYFIHEDEADNGLTYAKDVNDSAVGTQSYYLFAFCNVSYHTGYSSRGKVVLYYKEVPLFSSVVESVDEGRTSVVPPECSPIEPYYIEDGFRYLMFEFVFRYWSFNYSSEARKMFLRVIPVYKNDAEHEEFSKYVRENGIPPYMPGMDKEKLQGKALERIGKTEIGVYENNGNPSTTETIAQLVKNTPEMVINFANPENKCFQLITEELRKGKMMVDWLEDWRHNKD